MSISLMYCGFILYQFIINPNLTLFFIYICSGIFAVIFGHLNEIFIINTTILKKNKR